MQDAVQPIHSDHTLRARASRRITLLDAFTNAIQGGVKIIFGVLGHSHSLVADGLHSLSDLLTDILVLLASHYGSQAADRNHPYGHARIETIATMFLALILMMAGAAILWDAGEHFFGKGIPPKPNIYVLFVAALSITLNEFIFHYSLRVAKQVQSNLLRANAWHRRSDSGTSVAVLVGVTGTYFGFTYFDVIAAIIVGLVVIHMGWRLGWPSVRELVDTGLDPEVLDEVESCVRSIAGVKDILQIRTRLMGGKFLVEMHILVDGGLSVSEGHYVAQKVHQLLMTEIEEITDVTIHVDPEDDEKVKPSIDLPSREFIVNQLKISCSHLKGVNAIRSIVLHYLGGCVSIEIQLPMNVISDSHDAAQLREAYQNAVKKYPYICSVDVVYH